MISQTEKEKLFIEKGFQHQKQILNWVTLIRSICVNKGIYSSYLARWINWASVQYSGETRS